MCVRVCVCVDLNRHIPVKSLQGVGECRRSGCGVFLCDDRGETHLSCGAMNYKVSVEISCLKKYTEFSTVRKTCLHIMHTNTDINSAQAQTCNEAKLSIKHLNDPFGKTDFVCKPRTQPFISINGKQQAKQYVLRVSVRICESGHPFDILK